MNTMGNFDRGRGPRRSGGFGGGRRDFGGRSNDREMFDAVCNNCGRNCQVPFKPTGSRPVLCSDCFEKENGGGGGFDSRRAPRSDFRDRNDSRGRNDRGDREMFDAVCDNCGNKCQLPFRPTGEKPVYCSDCFEKIEGKGDKNTRNRNASMPAVDYKAQFEALNARLDKIMSILSPKVEKEEVKTEVVEVQEETKPEKKKKSVSKKSSVK